MELDLYLLFYGYKDSEGGAYDFHSIHSTADDARHAGIHHWSDGDIRLGSWMHLAHLSGNEMRVVARLNLPGSEQDEGVGLVWKAARS